MTDLSTCPHAAVPPQAKWREAMAGAPGDCKPFVGAKFPISRQDRLASAGSCFAQRVAGALRSEGYNYLVTEAGGPFLTSQMRQEQGFGAYSARYGNIYTSAQLSQLFDRAGLRPRRRIRPRAA
jgi:hypothetical protein